MSRFLYMHMLSQVTFVQLLKSEIFQVLLTAELIQIDAQDCTLVNNDRMTFSTLLVHICEEFIIFSRLSTKSIHSRD
jgi:hypothetical protein